MSELIQPPRRGRRARVALLVLGALVVALLGWLATGPSGSSAGQPCYRGWFDVSTLAADGSQALVWALLRQAALPVGGAQQTRIYLAPGQADAGSVRDLTQRQWRVWAPGRTATSLQQALAAYGQGAVRVEPLCGQLGAPELAVPATVVLGLCGLALVMVRTWWYIVGRGAA